MRFDVRMLFSACDICIYRCLKSCYCVTERCSMLDGLYRPASSKLALFRLPFFSSNALCCSIVARIIGDMLSMCCFCLACWLSSGSSSMIAWIISSISSAARIYSESCLTSSFFSQFSSIQTTILLNRPSLMGCSSLGLPRSERSSFGCIIAEYELTVSTSVNFLSLI